MQKSQGTIRRERPADYAAVEQLTREAFWNCLLYTSKSTSFLYGLYMGAQQLPMNDQIFLIQSKIIREIAEKGPCVIVGRCACLLYTS